MSLLVRERACKSTRASPSQMSSSTLWTPMAMPMGTGLPFFCAVTSLLPAYHIDFHERVFRGPPCRVLASSDAMAFARKRWGDRRQSGNAAEACSFCTASSSSGAVYALVRIGVSAPKHHCIFEPVGRLPHRLHRHHAKFGSLSTLIVCIRQSGTLGIGRREEDAATMINYPCL
ncbi:hypothetical protein AC579_5723 [Pseudocercospora musae]|uniref:Uncharacterized protein n=1 Tax=Pseudocercospora musae TaxID=113226 RepID=A0A139IRJ8_9PEZI|nr:hypothetical protein AC579_5723 [Pseudocercospora musae]